MNLPYTYCIHWLLGNYQGTVHCTQYVNVLYQGVGMLRGCDCGMWDWYLLLP